MALFIPESLTEETRRANSERIDKDEAEKRANNFKATTMLEYGSKLLRRASTFLAPLAIFVPQQRGITTPGRRGTEWNLALIAIAYGLFVLVESVGSFCVPSIFFVCDTWLDSNLKFLIGSYNVQTTIRCMGLWVGFFQGTYASIST